MNFLLLFFFQKSTEIFYINFILPYFSSIFYIRFISGAQFLSSLEIRSNAQDVRMVESNETENWYHGG